MQSELKSEIQPDVNTDALSDKMKATLDSYFNENNDLTPLQKKLEEVQQTKNESLFEEALKELKEKDSISKDTHISFLQTCVILEKALPYLKQLILLADDENIIQLFLQLSGKNFASGSSGNQYIFESFKDFEESLFVLSDYLSKNPSGLFEYLDQAVQRNVLTLYPIFSLCLHFFSKTNQFNQAEVLFNYLIRFEVEISTCAINNYIDSLCKANQIEQAQKLFETCCTYQPKRIFPCEHFKFTKYITGLGVNIVTYGTFIKWLCKSGNMETAMHYYTILKENNYLKDEIIYNLLIDGCSKLGELNCLKKIYFDMLNNSIKPTIVTFNTIIDAYVRAKDLGGAWKIFEDLLKNNIQPDNFTLSTLFRGIRHPKNREYLIKGLELVDNLSSVDNEKGEKGGADIILINVLLDSCIPLRESQLMIDLFKKVTTGKIKNVKPDLITYNTFIKGCAQMGLYKEVQVAFDDMCNNKKVIPNDVTFNTLIDVFVRSKDMNRVWYTIAKMKEMGIKPDNFTYSTIIKGLNKNTNLNCDDSQKETELDLGFKLFENVKKNSKPDEILYNCIMDACLRFGKIDKMLELYDNMLFEGIKPSSITCGIVIKAYGMQGNLDKALQIYDKMINEKIEISSVTFGCLINACIKNDNLQKAFELYEQFQNSGFEMNTILYTTLIKAYSKTKNLKKVIDIFEKMKESKSSSPNNITYNSIIDCCLKCGETALTDKYFEEMCNLKDVKPDIITFSTLIKGALKNKSFAKAMNYFNRMLKMNINPDEVLLNSLLDGCEKLGEYKQAAAIFKSITALGVSPTMMSYSIMMKIMGKLNDFEYSKKLIEEVKKKNKNLSLIIFTCFIKTCFSTLHLNEACETFFSLRKYKITPDEIAYNTMINGILNADSNEDFSAQLIKIVHGSVEARYKLQRHYYIGCLKYLKSFRLFKESNELGKYLEEHGLLQPRKFNTNYKQKKEKDNSAHVTSQSGHNSASKSFYNYATENNPNLNTNPYPNSMGMNSNSYSNERNPLSALWEKNKAAILNYNFNYNAETGSNYENQKKQPASNEINVNNFSGKKEYSFKPNFRSYNNFEPQGETKSFNYTSSLFGQKKKVNNV